MAEYIEREAAIDYIKQSQCKKCSDIGLCGNCAVLTGVRLFEEVPAADVAPIKHGQWEWFDEDTGTPITGYEREWGWRCSHCKHELPDNYDDPDYRPMLDYCLYCGAKMDGGANNG